MVSRSCARALRQQASPFGLSAKRAMSSEAQKFLKTVPTFPDYKIVDSTLREGEQFMSTAFTTQDRIYIAKMLDKMGVDYIEMVNPLSSKQAAIDCRVISELGLNAKVLTHTRCHMTDASLAVESGVAGVNIYMATSQILREHSHGKGIQAVIDSAREVISFVQSHGLEIRFSCEDTFRSDMSEVLEIYSEVSKMGVDRVGIADTVGISTPFQTFSVINAVREVVDPSIGIEFHVHNDTGCCISNALTALQAGATHIDTCVLGIGERNGITPLGGFLARMYTIDKESTTDRYDLRLLKHLEKYVAAASNISVPFNNYVTGLCAFTHKAGVHSKAVMANPAAYEIINPEDFGVSRQIEMAHSLTGWNAVAHRAKELELDINEAQIKSATSKMKNFAGTQRMNMEALDRMLMKLSQTSLPVHSSELAKQAENRPDLEEATKIAVASLEQYEEACVEAALQTMIEEDSKDVRPNKEIEVTGHLFDKQIINKIMDLVVDSPCSFEVKSLEVPPVNEDVTKSVIQLWGRTPGEIEDVIADITTLVTGAGCELALAEEVETLVSAN